MAEKGWDEEEQPLLDVKSVSEADSEGIKDRVPFETRSPRRSLSHASRDLRTKTLEERL